ncbi:sorbosone dehydrogenase family protein [Ancylobacter sp. 6x-1]|uniref:Sorbosone dehydrogenase family protein n=1 Tax=Ancylobacter crimeensis TaxID=2579147 RepID=A0ABT0D9U7_9HYPH|nr:sorbosone dehydrogenase family protein [Ancylobacter crimeensis]MCK0196720.1 sorbosone dehydrogenase family protein [Ancylobacter crimeensis]
MANYVKISGFLGACVTGVAHFLTDLRKQPALVESEGYGAAPSLPKPKPTLIPVMKIAPAVGWGAGQKPVPLAGYKVEAFATDLDHPRWVYELPNGDVLCAESAAPPSPAGVFSLRWWAQSFVMVRAGAGVKSANRISLLRDADGDGIAEQCFAFLEGLTSPFGMALVGEHLYVANADALVRFPYEPGATRITAAPVKICDLPAGRNHHWTKSLVANKAGTKLYVGVGSNSNVAEFGMEEEVDRAAILEVDIATGARRVFAGGLRNPVGMDWNPVTGELWTSVNERDEIGDDLVPDYMTSVKDGAFYGWPYSYWGKVVDERVKPQLPDLVARALKPDYALGCHTASLGLTFVDDSRFGERFTHGAFIGQHGSWNRNPPSGYRVIFVPFADGKPSGPPEEILGAFRVDGKALGRPVGVIVDRRGGLLVVDDVGDCVWRVSKA